MSELLQYGNFKIGELVEVINTGEIGQIVDIDYEVDDDGYDDEGMPIRWRRWYISVNINGKTKNYKPRDIRLKEMLIND